MIRSSCPKCGHDEHYILTSKRANRFGVTGRVVKGVQCADCGKKTSV